MSRIQSVERSIDVMMALRHGPKRLSSVADETGLTKGTTFRMLASLNHERLVVKDPVTGRYLLGPGFLRLVQGVLESLGAIVSSTTPILESLRDATGETVAIHVAIGAERVCLGEVQSEAPIRYSSYPGAAAALHLGSAGRVLLAFMDQHQRERSLQLLAANGKALASDRVSDVDGLLRELDVVREQGWAMSLGERIAGAAAITVPVLTKDMVLALSVLGPESRLDETSRLEMLPELREAAAAIERFLEQTDVVDA